MKPKIPKPQPEPEPPAPVGGKTRPPEAPLESEFSDSYREVQPPGFQDNPRSSIEAAAVDSEVDDTIGAE